MRDRNTCNYCIYCLYEKKEYHCRYGFDDYIIDKNNPRCEDYIEARTTALADKIYSIPRKTNGFIK